MEQTIKRTSFIVQGQVQGVGFRPFIWRLATGFGLTGCTRNTSAGVEVEIQGPENAISRFEQDFMKNLPPLARVFSLEKKELPVKSGENSFRIMPSMGHAGQSILVSPDVGICPECLADIRDPENFRHGYPFANCTNCGPRFTITRSLPYDRPSTCMACFKLCGACAEEYGDPANRRFHAQPIACAACGPAIWFVEKHAAETRNTEANRADALARAGRLLLNGGILALKGLGGFQLACDARNAEAVRRLRKLKKRPHKALAVMVGDDDSLRAFCDPSPEHLDCMGKPARPIVLCPRAERPAAPLVPEIAPDTVDIGVMAAYTPLHALLFDWLAANGMPRPALVMTSANPAGEPICLGNREALGRLEDLADGWLLHNRDILERVDDSVARLMPAPDEIARPLILRRARGYVPLPVRLPDSLPANIPSVLGMGAELKAAFCLTRGGLAFPGQHIGDLKSAATLDFYEHALEHMKRLLETSPEAIVHDSHPDFITSSLARELGGKYHVPVWALQHHAAHAASVLAENGHAGLALAICLDGSGLGNDGTIWGGELLRMDLEDCAWERLGSLSPFALPGGEAAIREPWRTACGLGRRLPENSHLEGREPIVLEMLDRGLNCPLTSSAGRLFDAFAALLGLCDVITYEGQAAIRLEKAASAWFTANPGPPAPFHEIRIFRDGNLWRIDSQGIFAAAQKALDSEMNEACLAAAFHHLLAEAFADMAALAAHEYDISVVGLSGGALQNKILAEMLIRALQARNLKPLCHRDLPPGDGGVSYGQAVWGAYLLARQK